MDLIAAVSGKRCRRCGYSGDVREGAPNEINAFRAGLKNKSNAALSGVFSGKSQSQHAQKQADDLPLKERLKNKHELENVADAEFL